ncbi:hypothetical protein D3C80_1778070 [compost metagenome]
MLQGLKLLIRYRAKRLDAQFGCRILAWQHKPGLYMGNASGSDSGLQIARTGYGTAARIGCVITGDIHNTEVAQVIRAKIVMIIYTVDINGHILCLISHR